MPRNDEIDRRILRELQRHARLTNVELAERVGLSPSACLRRVQELERSGVISGYHARVDPLAGGAGFIAYVTVALSSHSKENLEAFERAVAGAPQVVECHNITGATSYLLRVEVAGLQQYKKFDTETLAAVPGVAQITTHVLLATTKHRFD